MMMNYGFGGSIMMLVAAAVIVVPFYKLWGRTGHNPWISLLMLLPLINLILLYVLAFKEWPHTDNKG